MANAAELRRKAADVQRKALALVNLAADEDRELTDDEQATLVELIGPPDADCQGGEAGRHLRQAAILDRIETNLANAAKPPARTSAPVQAPTSQQLGNTLDGVRDRLAGRYSQAN